MRIKKIILCLILVGIVSAFPLRLLNLSSFYSDILILSKGIIVICLLYLLIRRDGLHVKLFHISSGTFSKKIIPALILLFIYAALNYKKMFFINGPYSNKALLMIIIAFVLAYAEEIVFRCYVQTHLIQLVPYKYQAILIGSGLFALMHFLNIYKADDIFSLINQIIFAFFMGILLGSLFFITNSVLFTGLYHFFINLPAAFNRLQSQNTSHHVELSQSLIDNIISSFLFILFISPMIIISIHYLIGIKKNEQHNASHINYQK